MVLVPLCDRTVAKVANYTYICTCGVWCSVWPVGRPCEREPPPPPPPYLLSCMLFLIPNQIPSANRPHPNALSSPGPQRIKLCVHAPPLLPVALEQLTLEAASARMAARDRFGGFGEPPTSQLQRFICKICPIVYHRRSWICA